MGHLTYLLMLLPWALAVIAAQWLVGAAALRSRLRLVAAATAIATAYLCVADGVAIAQGIWTIHDDRVIGLRLGGVPLEEMLFFLLTDLMVVQSVVLLNAPEVRASARRLLSRVVRPS